MSGEGRRRGRVRFSDPEFSEGTSLATLPDAERPPTSAPIEQLARNPRNARMTYEDEATAQLAASLAEHGQMQPVLVVARDVYLGHYPDEADRIGVAARWVVITGNRRHAAAEAAGLARLDMVVRDHLGGDDTLITEAMLIENIHRQDLPPLLEARELQGLVERHGSQGRVAERLSKTQGWVSQRLALLRLTPEMKSALEAGDVTLREARAVASKPDQTAALAALRSPTPERVDPLAAANAPDPALAAHPAPAQDIASDTSAEAAGAAPNRTRADRKSSVTPRAATGAMTDEATRVGAAERPDVARIAQELRGRLSDSELVELVALLSNPA